MQTLDEHLSDYKSVILGTISQNGYPFSSYAPYYYDGETIYIFISDIATHAKNIQENPQISSLFIEDESQSNNIFARRRISLQCNVLKVDRQSTKYADIIRAFQSKFEGGTFTMLMGMKDFNLYALTPIYGEATFGFGEAYHIGGEKMNQLVTRTGDTGHK